MNILSYSNLSIATLMAAALLSCQGTGGKQQAYQEDGIQFDSVVVDTTAALNANANAPKCQLHISMQTAKGSRSANINAAILKSGILTPDYLALMNEKMTIKQAVDTFVACYIKDYKNNYDDIYRQEPTSNALNVSYNLSTRTSKGKGNVIVYTASVYQYEGGDHGVRLTVVKNINPETGKVITLNDVFVPGYQRPLADLITGKLEEDKDCDNIDRLRQKGFFVGITPYPSDNFIYGSDGITFIYCTNEIASNAEGEIHVKLSYSEMEKILKK